MLGMLSASLAATMMVGGATRFGVPVSTTHAVVGSVIGFSFVKTTNGLIWFKGKNGLGAVMVSWLISPLFSGFVAAIVYVLARRYCFQVRLVLCRAVLRVRWGANPDSFAPVEA
jgi:PiT family inorganic phosphate transporter